MLYTESRAVQYSGSAEVIDMKLGQDLKIESDKGWILLTILHPPNPNILV